jgi:hypothetical protein
MIKVYCDKCGKEITGNVNAITEETEAFDLEGNSVVTFKDTVQICDECQYDDLTCGFKVGDQVITSTGKVGQITELCTCDRCKERGFYEPNVEVKIGSGHIWITGIDKNNGFIGFYQIGNRVFGNLDEEYVLDSIKSKKEEIYNMHKELIELESQLCVVQKLKNN